MEPLRALVKDGRYSRRENHRDRTERIISAPIR